MNPAQLRDSLNRMDSPKPGAKILVPWTKGYRTVTGYRVDEDGNVILEMDK